MSTLAKSRKAYEFTQSEQLLNKVFELEANAQRIKEEFMENKDLNGALRAVRELVRIVELLARIQGEIQANPKINVFISHEWTRVQSLILKSMEPYPEAKRSLLCALEELNEYQ
jgi:hypothetical protein